MIVRDIIECFESFAPKALQESYDNCGLQVGNPGNDIDGVLIAMDCSLALLEEAKLKKFNLVLTHHPVIFNPLKKITGTNETERMVEFAIRNNINILSLHTNIDNVWGGINFNIAEKLNLLETEILLPKQNLLKKIVTFCPLEHAERVRNAIFQAGGGFIGNYSDCSFNVEGTGSFKALDGANPFVGQQGEIHFEKEIRIETIFPAFNEDKVLKALFDAHPYEEVAYDIYQLCNSYKKAGAGIIGNLKEDFEKQRFLQLVKEKLNCKILRYNNLWSGNVKKVAVCSGSGGGFMHAAIKNGADAFVTADLSYHRFEEAGRNLLLIDAGHFETEQYVCELLIDIISKKFPNFAAQISENHINPVGYF